MRIAGIDEVGRGALAGPVVVGCVWVEEGFERELAEILQQAAVSTLRDSKKLTRLQRERLFEVIIQKFVWKVGEATPAEIDELGLSAALKLAAGRALGENIPELVRADAGLFHPFEDTVKTERYIKGDELYPEISLASVVAKVHRDRLMRDLSPRYPQYGWETNVGYGTRSHVQALQEQGASGQHRKLFLRKLALKG